MTNALIVYGTRYGATTSTSEDIAEVLRQEGLDVNLVNAKKDKINDINDYDLVIVGNGIKIKKWTKEPRKFPQKVPERIDQKEDCNLHLLWRNVPIK